MPLTNCVLTLERATGLDIRRRVHLLQFELDEKDASFRYASDSVVDLMTFWSKTPSRKVAVLRAGGPGRVLIDAGLRDPACAGATDLE